MANVKAKSSTGNLVLYPTQVGIVMKGVWAAKRVPFLWGPPGIGKSDLLKQQATAMGIAYIDIRLATKNPSQVSGVPFPEEIHGMTNVRYSIPVEFPRDIDVDSSIEITGRRKLRFNTVNPKGSNGIHYCVSPTYTVESFDKNKTAKIVDQSPDHLTVELRDAEGNYTTGMILYTMQGLCRAVLCFDELSSANPSVQAVAYSLINDRRLGEYIFPDGVMLCAAGNREEDRGVSYKMAQPLRNRFTHYTLVTRLEDFLAYGKLVGCYQPILQFHENTQGKYLFAFDPESSSMAWASPRSWMILSDLEYSFDQIGIMDTTIRLLEIAGTIGESIALMYQQFKQERAHLPNPNDILAGRGDMTVKLDSAGQMFVAGGISLGLKSRLKTLLEGKSNTERREIMKSTSADDFYAIANNVFVYMNKMFKPDIMASVVRDMSMVHQIPLDPRRMPAFAEYVTKSGGGKVAL